MDPQKRFCHNRDCWVYSRAGEGHIVIHSQKQRRYRCKRCGQTFSATKGTALYLVHKPHELVTTVVTLLAYGNTKADGSASGFTNTSRKPAGCSWHKSRPMSCVCES